jgi:hypothetical protein
MADSKIYRCPECGVGAIWVKVTSKPHTRVDCAICHTHYTLEKLLKLLKKNGRKW